jgi:hypothetical protein
MQQPNLIKARWTPEQVAALNEYQQDGRFHPYTCGRRDDHLDDSVLVATPDGWVCPHPGCGYTQKWAYASTVDISTL